MAKAKPRMDTYNVLVASVKPEAAEAMLAALRAKWPGRSFVVEHCEGAGVVEIFYASLVCLRTRLVREMTAFVRGLHARKT